MRRESTPGLQGRAALRTPWASPPENRSPFCRSRLRPANPVQRTMSAEIRAATAERGREHLHPGSAVAGVRHLKVAPTIRDLLRSGTAIRTAGRELAKPLGVLRLAAAFPIPNTPWRQPETPSRPGLAPRGSDDPAATPRTGGRAHPAELV